MAHITEVVELEYTPNLHELTQASIDFLNSRPAIKLMKLAIKLSIFFIVGGFMLKFASNTHNMLDVLAMILMAMWLFSYRQLHYMVSKAMLKRKAMDATVNRCQVTKDKFWYQSKGKCVIQQNLQEFKHIYRNAHGYIIPFTGFANAGSFAWLPKNSFKSMADENKFLAFLKTKKLEVKPL